MTEEHARVLLKEGVTRDLIEVIMSQARKTSDDNPASIFFYSVWKVCAEIHSYLEDEQGTPTSEWARINIAIKGPLAKFLQVAGLQAESPAAEDALVRLLKGLHRLRSPE